jgi:hypothetical protein
LAGNLRQVTAAQGQELAKEIKCPYVESSARTADNVNKAFEFCIAEIEKQSEPSKPAGDGKCTLM